MTPGGSQPSSPVASAAPETDAEMAARLQMAYAVPVNASAGPLSGEGKGDLESGNIANAKATIAHLPLPEEGRPGGASLSFTRRGHCGTRLGLV